MGENAAFLTNSNAAETAKMVTAVAIARTAIAAVRVVIGRCSQETMASVAAIAKQATAVDYAAIGRPNRAHRQTVSSAVEIANITTVEDTAVFLTSTKENAAETAKLESAEEFAAHGPLNQVQLEMG